VETAGRGVLGEVDGVAVAVGSAAYVREQWPTMPRISAAMDALDDGQDGLQAWAAMSDGTVVRVDFADVLRRDLTPMLQQLSALGLRPPMLLSGDKTANVQAIAERV